ncbi:MAG: hypothetical protein RI996_607 [Candidatus Parcubacteria bacterium]|jgi:predicted flap endonuclease-1-like 5' DNA nuclease
MINKKVLLFLASMTWVVISWNTYTSQSIDSSNGWEVIVILTGSFALGWIAHYILYISVNGQKSTHVEIETNTFPERVTKYKTESPDVLPTEGMHTKRYQPIGVYATYEEDDFQIIEGIGPKINELLKSKSITTWKELSETSTEKISEILTDAGPRFQFNNPKTWAEQARLAYEGKWNELEVFQNSLIGGL